MFTRHSLDFFSGVKVSNCGLCGFTVPSIPEQLVLEGIANTHNPAFGMN